MQPYVIILIYILAVSTSCMWNVTRRSEDAIPEGRWGSAGSSYRRTRYRNGCQERSDMAGGIMYMLTPRSWTVALTLLNDGLWYPSSVGYLMGGEAAISRRKGALTDSVPRWRYTSRARRLLEVRVRSGNRRLCSEKPKTVKWLSSIGVLRPSRSA